MRSDAVSLDVPVKVHGTRMKDSEPNATGEPFEENTSSMIVFPQGGVLKMASAVAAGQMMVVTNLKSGHDAICRVVKVRAFAQGQSYVEIEFTHRQPGYWGVYFPSDGEGAASPNLRAPATTPVIAATATSEAKVDKVEEKTASEPKRVAGPPLKIPVKPAAKNDSAFAPIGSQEEVQPAAAPTSSRVKPGLAAESQKKSASAEGSAKDALDDLAPQTKSSKASPFSMADLQGDASTAVISFAGAGVPGEVADMPDAEESEGAADSAPAFGRFAATANPSEHAAAREPFGSTFGSGTLSIGGDSGKASQSKSGHGLAIAASVIATLGLAGAGAYYFHLLPFGAKPAAKTASIVTPAPARPVESAASSAPAPAAQIANSGTSTAAPIAMNNAPAQPSSASLGGTAATSRPILPARENVAPSPSKTVKPAPTAAKPAIAAAAAPANQNPAAKVPDMFAALNAHPTAHAYSGDTAAAPDVSTGAPDSSGLPAISAPAAIAAPAPVQQGPVRIRVGGALKPPRLVSSVLPVYPQMARETGIEGDVVLDASIDKNGNVTSAKVVSGPPVLRQAALDALRKWKYEASRLDGEPVAVEMMVTLKFHRQ